MRTKVTLFLLFLNVALFFYIFVLDPRWNTEDIARDARRQVLGPEAANIQFLELAGPALDTLIRLERQGDAWRITRPYEWPANPFAVDRIIKELQFLEHETSYEVANLGATGLSLADYDLENPPLTVTFGTLPPAEDAPGAAAAPAALSTTLAIGSRTAIGNRLYVLSPDRSRVHVVPQTLAQALSLDLEDLRADNCFTIPNHEVRSLNLQAAGPANVRVRIRREGSRWTFESPIITRADTAATQDALSKLRDLETLEFIGDPAAHPERASASGTNTPSLRITLEGNNRRETLLLGNSPGEAPAADATTPPAEQVYYARIENRAALFTVAIPTELLNTLQNAQARLRDPLVLDLSGRTVDSISLTDGDGNEVILQKLESGGGALANASGWQVVRRADDGTLHTQPADRSVVEEMLLRDLRELRAQSFVRDVPTEAQLEDWGLSRPERIIALNFSAETPSPLSADNLTLLIGTDQTGDNTYAKLRRQTFVYAVSPAILASTPVDPLHYRQRLLRDLPAGARITGLTLRDMSTNTVLYQRELREGETWDQVFANLPRPQGPALATLRSEVRTLRARRFIADPFTETIMVEGEQRAWRYRLDTKLSLTGDAGNQVIDSTLFIADRAGGDLQLVGSPEFNVIFAATQPFIEALWTLTYAERDPGPIEFTAPPPGTPTPTDPEP